MNEGSGSRKDGVDPNKSDTGLLSLIGSGLIDLKGTVGFWWRYELY